MDTTSESTPNADRIGIRGGDYYDRDLIVLLYADVGPEPRLDAEPCPQVIFQLHTDALVGWCY